MTFGGWIISHRYSWITVYVFCHNVQSESHSDPHDICMLALFYQLPNCNLFIQHVVIYLIWRDTTSELWTLVQFLYIAITVLLLLAFLHSCKLLPFTTRYV
jgi:hypothetical protein